MPSDPAFTHDRVKRVGVLLVNLGTPDAPTASAVRRYLAQFLSDPRVVEIPRLVWLPILHGIVLRIRPAKSAEKYAAIWTEAGSPLLAYSQRQRVLLQGILGERMKALGLPEDFLAIELGMRYGTPDIASAMDRLRTRGCDLVLVVPLYPQFAASTTATALDVVYDYAKAARRMPGLRAIDCFHDDPGYIRALARIVSDHWQREGRPDKLVLSFHGLPRRTLELGDPYHCQCQKTGRLLAEELGLTPNQFMVTFQSRFGNAEWLQPYTAATLEALPKQGVGRVDIICPGFVSDCLETLEEIGIEGRETFMKAGGREYHVLPCLNDHPAWIEALADMVLRNLGGWLERPPDAEARAATLARATAMGASR